MVAAFAAAYMSTIATQLNWGASYLVNDFYRRFWKPNAPPRHYVTASQAGDNSAYGHFRHRDVLSRFHRRRVEAAARNRRGHGQRAVAALVLVAHQRVERGIRDDRRVCRVTDAADRFSYGFRRSAQFRVHHDDHRRHHHGGVAGGNVRSRGPSRATCWLRFIAGRVRAQPGWRPIAKLAPEVKPEHDWLGEPHRLDRRLVLIYGVLFGTGKLLLHETGSRVRAARVRPRGRQPSFISIFREEGGVRLPISIGSGCSPRSVSASVPRARVLSTSGLPNSTPPWRRAISKERITWS